MPGLRYQELESRSFAKAALVTDVPVQFSEVARNRLGYVKQELSIKRQPRYDLFETTANLLFPGVLPTNPHLAEYGFYYGQAVSQARDLAEKYQARSVDDLYQLLQGGTFGFGYIGVARETAQANWLQLRQIHEKVQPTSWRKNPFTAALDRVEIMAKTRIAPNDLLVVPDLIEQYFSDAQNRDKIIEFHNAFLRKKI